MRMAVAWARVVAVELDRSRQFGAYFGGGGEGNGGIQKRCPTSELELLGGVTRSEDWMSQGARGGISVLGNQNVFLGCFELAIRSSGPGLRR